MNILDLFWVGSIAAAFIGLLIVTLIFWVQQGRIAIYLTGVLLACTLASLISLVTAVEVIAESGNLPPWFKLARTCGWAFVVATTTAYILFQLGVLNHQNRSS